jgi:hypothetical protein
MPNREDLRRKLGELGPEDRKLLEAELAATAPAPPSPAERAAREAEIRALARQSKIRDQVRRHPPLRELAAQGAIKVKKRPKPEPDPPVRDDPPRSPIADRAPASDVVGSHHGHPHRREW